MGLTSRVRAWGDAGELIDLGGHRIFVRAQDGEGPPVLFLHGYPSSSYDWRSVFEGMPGRRIVAFDFLGFGLSDKPRDHRYSLCGQADLAEAIVARYFPGEPVALIAHDMGTSVTTELLARDLDRRLPFELARVLLFNGSMVIERASLTLDQKLLRSRLGPIVSRLSNRRGFRRSFGRIFSASHPLTQEEADDQWALLEYNDGNRILDKLIFYLHERVSLGPRWHGALRKWPGRLELAWACRDPICTEAVLQAVLSLRPAAPLTRFPPLGHYPQIEDPVGVTAVVDTFVGS
ncbi:MAG TPA: alpha/beta hydrolase [Solirubrobacteraceae bacterium]